MDLNISVGDSSPTRKESTGIRESRGQGRANSSGKWGDIKLTNYDDIKWRLDSKVIKVKKFSTGIKQLDDVFGGGLALGLNTFMGDGGAGKSLMAREIAKNHKTLYLCCEVLSDAPPSKEYPNVCAVDYTQYPTKAHKAFDSSFDNVPKSPSIVLLTALRACVHIPSCTNKGSESLFNPFIKELVCAWEVSCCFAMIILLLLYHNLYKQHYLVNSLQTCCNIYHT